MLWLKLSFLPSLFHFSGFIDLQVLNFNSIGIEFTTLHSTDILLEILDFMYLFGSMFLVSLGNLNRRIYDVGESF